MKNNVSCADGGFLIEFERKWMRFQRSINVVIDLLMFGDGIRPRMGCKMNLRSRGIVNSKRIPT